MICSTIFLSMHQYIGDLILPLTQPYFSELKWWCLL